MNPITKARNLSGIPTTRLAKELGVSRQYITRVEQGLYDNVNKKLLNWTADILFEEDEPNSTKILEDYNSWQWDHRKSSKDSKLLRPIEINPYHRPDIIYYHKVFRSWRELYWDTTHGFCVDMCLHPSSVNNYEDGSLMKMPPTMKEVLSRLGLLGEGFKTNER